MKKRSQASPMRTLRYATVSIIMLAATSTGFLRAELQPEQGREVPVLRPAHMRQGDRDRMMEENRQSERLGNEMSRLREAAHERGEDIPSLEELREQAEQRLFQASESFSATPMSGSNGAPFGEMRGSPAGQHGMQLVCFSSDGTVTTNRDECDADQGRHFGMQPPETMQGALPYPTKYPSPDELGEHMNAYFGDSGSAGGGDLLPIISEALTRVSDMLSYVQEDPTAVAQAQQTIRWLSGLLNQYSSGQMSAAEEMHLAEEVSVHLSTLQESTHPEFDPGDMTFGPNMGMILGKMDMMMEKLPQVIGIFEEAGIPVAPEAQDAYARSMALFEELRAPCSEGDMDSCFRLKEIPEILDREMRPPMEEAMMAAGQAEVGERIEALMHEGMEDGMGPGAGPRHMMPPGFGPMQGSDRMMPPGFMPPPGSGQMPSSQFRSMPPYGSYDMPEGYEQMMPPEGMMPYGEFRGMPPSGEYELPEGYEHMMPPYGDGQGMPSNFMPPSGYEQMPPYGEFDEMPPYGGYELPPGYDQMGQPHFEQGMPEDF